MPTAQPVAAWPVPKVPECRVMHHGPPQQLQAMVTCTKVSKAAMFKPPQFDLLKSWPSAKRHLAKEGLHKSLTNVIANTHLCCENANSCSKWI